MSSASYDFITLLMRDKNHPEKEQCLLTDELKDFQDKVFRSATRVVCKALKKYVILSHERQNRDDALQEKIRGIIRNKGRKKSGSQQEKISLCRAKKQSRFHLHLELDDPEDVEEESYTFIKTLVQPLKSYKSESNPVIDIVKEGNVKLLKEMIARSKKSVAKPKLNRGKSSSLLLMSSPVAQKQRRFSLPGMHDDSPLSRLINQRDAYGRSAFTTALEHRNWECAKILMEEDKIDMSVVDISGNTALHLLLGSDEHDKWQDILQSMIQHHFMDVNARNREGTTPLMIAASNPDVETYEEGSLMETLVALKANPLLTDLGKRTALDYAASSGNLKNLERLIRLMRLSQEQLDGVLFNLVDSPQAAQMRTFEFLVHQGASLACKKKGDSLLNAAARNNQLRCLALLLERLPRAELKYRNPKGFSALHSAVALGRQEAAELIMNKMFPPETPKSSRREDKQRGEGARRRGEFSDMIDDKLIEAAVQSNSAKIILNSLQTAPQLKNVEINVDKDLPESWRAKFGEDFSEEEVRDNIATIFKLIDTDGSGSITVDEMIGGLQRQGIFLSMTAAKDLIASMDVDGTGEIELSEFESAIKGGLKRRTNLLCWSISNRFTDVVEYLLDIGADVNRTDPGGEKMSPLMLVISCLSLSSWSQYAIKSIIQEDSDSLALSLGDVSSITSMTKPQICASVELLKDMRGNPLKSPSGKPLFTRNPWSFSWNGLKAICSSKNSDLSKQIESYTKELEDYKEIYLLLLRCPALDLDLEVRGKTAAALAAQYKNWMVYEDLMEMGASSFHPSVLYALAVSNSEKRLRESIALAQEGALTEAAVQDIFDATCEAGGVECAWVLHEFTVRKGWRIVRPGHLKQVVQAGQSWIIDLVSHFDRSRESLGVALIESISHGDLKCFKKLLEIKADPNFEPASAGEHRCPLTIAGSLWCRNGSMNHLEMILELINKQADLLRCDEDGRNVVSWACVKGHERLLRTSISALRSRAVSKVEEAINLKDKNGKTPLMHAVLACSSGCVQQVLQAGADANVLSTPCEEGDIPMTALAYVTSMAQDAAPEFLLPLVRCTDRLDLRDACGDSFVTWAARWGHADAFRLVLEKGEGAIGLYEPDAGGLSALELACMARHRSICKMIVDTWDMRRTTPDSVKNSEYAGISLLQRCLDYDWPDVLLSLIKNLCPFDKDHPVVKRAVYHCLQRKWFDCLRALLRPPRSIDPTSRNVIESSPLLLASRRNDVEALQELLRANVRELEMAVLCCIFYGYMSSFNLLWRTPSLTPSQDFLRACACLASLRNNVTILQQVIRRASPSVNIHSKSPKLRFLMKEWCSNRVLIRDLPDLHRYLEIEDPSVPLLCAVSHGHLKCATLLLESKADPLVSDYHGVSAITWACAVGNIDVVQALLKVGVSINLEPCTLSFQELRSFYAKVKMRQLGSLAYVKKTRLVDLLENKTPTIHMSPLFAALMKGNPDVVRLLMEAGARRSELVYWCEGALKVDPSVEPLVSDMLLLATEYEDFKTFGPFGNPAYTINFSDAPLVPSYGSLHSIIVQFSATEWKLEAIQVVHRVDDEYLPLTVHHTSSSLAGRFLEAGNLHLERFDLRENEFIIQAEVAILEGHIHALRFTTNQRVCKWLGVKSEPDRGSRVVTVAPAGREVVGLFSACEDRFYQMGFITRLRMGDVSWRPKRMQEKG
mmetsp:Transcript_18174/g.59694  ORF Transcript_18174/g.59694 Transcript_18174/m.59694 type:complete len:1690 (-) Transcript_18174:210-5279(-)